MERVSVTQAVRQFSDLLNRVFYQGVSVELERGNKVIARISPVSSESPLKVKDLNKLFSELPALGEDAKSFAKDLKYIRRKILLEKSQWGLVLDTNVFIFSERSMSPIDFSKWREYGDVYISSVTVSELLVGGHYARSESRKARRSAFVESVLGKFPVLAFDREVARVHAGLFATLARQGRMIGAHDLIIAATALFHGCAVLTDNTDEFGRVAGLETISYIKLKYGKAPSNR